MGYSLIKHITPKKKRPLRHVLNGFIILVAIPVTVIASVCILLYFAFLRVRSLWIKTEAAEESYHVELELIRNTHLTLWLVEDEHDDLLTSLNDDWTREVYREQTCLYRIKCMPVIPALENKVCCFYAKEQPEGTIIQLLDDTTHTAYGNLNTRLVLINYPGLELSYIDDAGPFFLYNNKNDTRVISGFNESERIEIQLVKD